MTTERIHRAASDDGTEIAGRVVGEGPALVLVHGMIGDGDLAWRELTPHLTDRFTCHRPSVRGRGLSGDHPDHTIARWCDDITAYVASLDEPACLLGWSAGGPLVLAAAERLDTVTAVAAWESGASPLDAPPVLMEDLGRLFPAIEQVGIAASEGRMTDAVPAFLAGICNDEEIAALEGTDFHERWADGIPDMLVGFENMQAETSLGSFAPEELAKITAPTAFFVATETLLDRGFPAAAEHLARQIDGAQVREVPGVGHLAPIVAPDVVATEVAGFLESVLQPA
ncbi:MAG TPA: alpha/beta hydrolase [Jiangellaceae bacterium]